MRIQYARSALVDLASISEFYGGKSPQGLKNIFADIFNTIDELPSSISQGRMTDVPDVWEKLSRKYRYLIPYTIVKDVVWVLRVYNTSQKGYDILEIINNPDEFR